MAASALASYATWTSLLAGHDPASFQQLLTPTLKQQGDKANAAGMYISCFLLVATQGSVFRASQDLNSKRPGQPFSVRRESELDYPRMSDLERIERVLSLIENSFPEDLRLAEDTQPDHQESSETFQSVRLALVSVCLQAKPPLLFRVLTQRFLAVTSTLCDVLSPMSR